MDIEQQNRVKLMALNAMYGQIGPNLLRYTGDVRDGKFIAQIIVFEDTSEGEIDIYQSIGTEIMSNFPEPFIEEEIVRITDLNRLSDIKPLPLFFFCRIVQQF